MSVHVEHSAGKALIFLVPVDESLLLRNAPGTQGPSLGIFSRPTRPIIFAATEASVLKIAVMADGSITVDGSPATVESTRVALRSLAQQNGVVWYYREDGAAPAPPQANEIIKAVIENRLSIRLSSRPDYSDAIGPDGKPLPEKPTTR